MQSEEDYWSQRYQEERTGWDIGSTSTPLKEYIDQLENKELRILIPGAGNAYEAEYLFKQGFQQVFVLDISKEPLQALQKRVPDFPSENLLHADFFKFEGQYDLILEQTFFCSFEPSKENREAYAKKMFELLTPGGKLAGLWFSHALEANGNRPFGGSQKEYEEYLNPYFETHTLAPSYNSIKPRVGNELFGIFIKQQSSMNAPLEFFLEEFKQEAKLTRSFLAKVPFDNPSYKPHEKSETLGRLAIHVAELIAWWKNVLEESFMDFEHFKPEQLKTTEALLEYFDELYAETLDSFANAKNEILEQEWTMKHGEEIYMTLPKKQILRVFCMNHLVHHRAQLGVYLRMLDIEIPATYGPSADDFEVTLLHKF